MKPIRIVIVDDSAFVRKVVKEMLSDCPDIEVVGMARNGDAALPMVAALQPDVVTCDLTMPECDGVRFVRQQMAARPVPILILTASPQDAAFVLDALGAGAIDFIQKPTAFANESLFLVRNELIEKIRAAAHAPTRVLLPSPNLPPARPRPSLAAAKVDIVVLGISTGGPQALRYLIPQLAKDFPVPLVMVLHMPVGYTAIFAEKLAELSRLPVREAFADCPVQPGEVLLAPAGRHLSFKRLPDGKVTGQLTVNPLDKPHRPSVDVLFQSAAAVYGRRVLGVVMTGMGNDGFEGAAAIKAQGGMILTESEESCIIYGMPRVVVESGLSDASVSLASMAEEINKRL
jgi:two-component system, chemotaxis family, protein-glutamate methylesterase/glutaminase